jgi:hypothetical protein
MMKVVLNTIKQTKKHIFEVKIFIVGPLLASLPMFALKHQIRILQSPPPIKLAATK